MSLIKLSPGLWVALSQPQFRVLLVLVAGTFQYTGITSLSAVGA